MSARQEELPGIDLPPDRIDFIGRALLPNPKSPKIIDAFDFRNVYRTFDNVGISFITPRRTGEGTLEDQRITMALPDFVAMVLDDEGRELKSLSEEERTSLGELGFDLEEIETAEELAISFNKLRFNNTIKESAESSE